MNAIEIGCMHAIYNIIDIISCKMDIIIKIWS